MTELSEWITPKEAAALISDRAGYRVKVDDIRQLRRTGKITKTLKLSDRMTLYNLEEIRAVRPPDKRRKVQLDEAA